MDLYLLDLIEKSKTYKYQYETCHQFWKTEFYNKWQETRLKLKEYASQQGYMCTSSVPYLPYTRLDDQTENFENYAI